MLSASDDCIAKSGNCADSCSDDDRPITCDDLKELMENGCLSTCPDCYFKHSMASMGCRKILFLISIWICYGLNLVAFKLKNHNSKLVPETECQSNECWCINAGGNTCGASRNEACDPDECYDRNECPGKGYWCNDAGSTT